MIKSTNKTQVEAAIRQADREAGVSTFTFEEIQTAIQVLETDPRYSDTRYVKIAAKNRNAIAVVGRGNTGWWIIRIHAR